MDVKIICLFVSCICKVVGLIMSRKLRKRRLKWLLITLLLIGLVINASHLFFLILTSQNSSARYRKV